MGMPIVPPFAKSAVLIDHNGALDLGAGPAESSFQISIVAPIVLPLGAESGCAITSSTVRILIG